MFPAFCDVKAQIIDCKKQAAAFISITKQLTKKTASPNTPLNLLEETCTTVTGEKTCLNHPDIESADYHWLMPIMKKYTGINLGTTSYHARGAGMIKGAA
jgi:hypothetical protein